MKEYRRVKRLDPNTVVLIKQIVLGLLSVLLVAGILTAVWYGTRIDRYTLQHVVVSGGETINHESVRERVHEQLKGEYAGFIPRTFAFLYPHDDVVAAVSEVERIHTIQVSRQDGRTLAVSFDEYLPKALWCSGPESSDCLFLDGYGYAYAPAPNLKGGSLLRFSHTSKEPVIGERLTSEEDFSVLQDLQSRLAEIGWFVSWIEIDQARDAFLLLVNGGEMKVSLEYEPAQTIENLQVILASDEFSDLEPGGFAYIDLRFGEKVFVNEEMGVLEETATSSAEVDEMVVSSEPEE